jgi:hypothetical protein
MHRTKHRTNSLNRSSQPNKLAQIYPLSPITLGLYLHATRPTPDTHKPAPQAALTPLAQKVENASVRRWPYDSTFAPLRLATSSTTPLQATEHAVSPLKSPFSRKYSPMTQNRYNQFLWINLSSAALDTSHVSLAPRSSSRPLAPVPLLSPCSPLPPLLLLESPLSRPPASGDNPLFLTASRRVRSTLTPKVNLSDQGRLPSHPLHYAGAALVDHVVLKGVQVETQADCTMFTSALAFCTSCRIS